MSVDYESQALDDFTRRIAGLDPEKAQEVLRELDPTFVRDMLKRMMTALPKDSQMKVMRAAKRMEISQKPTNDQELWEYIRDECELKIPRKAVCEGHCSPFDFLSDIYFERGNHDKLAVGNRGSGKTQVMGALHAVNARTKPKYTSCTVGAVEAQSVRAYNFFREQMMRERWMRLISGRIAMGKTEITGGGKVEIVIGTITGVNSPHPILAHFDEVELLREGVFDEALNMAQSKNGYRAMNILTSSWKKPRGFVSQLIDEVQRAEREGEVPPYQVYRWCVWETTESCEHDCDACPFSNVVKGEWEDGSKRTFESACKRGSPVPGTGKLKHTDGFVALEDGVARFRKLPRRVFESQQESKRPTMEGLIYDVFDEDRHWVERWDPDPALGVIDVGLDFGGTNAHAANFYQTLDHEMHYGGKVLPQGAVIVFDEVHIEKVGNVEFGRAINAKIDFWQGEYPDFEVEGFYGDPAARAGREDMAALATMNAGASIRVRFSGHVDVDPRIALVYELMAEDMVYADRIRCPEWFEEIGGYERNPNTGKPVKESDHHMDAMGYRFWNRHARNRRVKTTNGDGPVGRSRPRAVQTRDEQRVWDPSTLGTVPEYHGSRDADNTPAILAIPRTIRSPFG